MHFTKKLGKYRMFQISNGGKAFELQIFKWKMGFNIQLLGCSLSYFFNRGSYLKSKNIIMKGDR